MKATPDRFMMWLLCSQGIYFILSGIWPVIDINSFMAVTCPKTDLWLVKTLGVIFFCEGVCFVLGGMRKEGGLPIVVLSFINAIAIIFIDCYYVFKGTICPVYLADAAVECIIVICWMIILFQMRSKTL
jgi:hypothetical protein